MATPVPANQARFTSSEVAAAVGGSLTAGGVTGDAKGDTTGSEHIHQGVTTDSRAIVRGGAFVALRGERHDGHSFLSQAIAAGATLLVVERGRSLAVSPAGVDVVEVDDTLVAWGELARTHLARWRHSSPAAVRRVVAITGSTGKTTTKELVAALLATVDVVRATDGNLNNRIGLPATIFTLTGEHRFAILECGMSLPGEMAQLARIVSPDVAAITMVGLAHAENVGGTPEGVALEKGALFDGVAPGGTVVANLDDPFVVARAVVSVASQRVSFGRAATADVRLVDRTPSGFDGSALILQRPGEPPFSALLPIVGEGAAMDFACAIACADAALGRRLTPDEIRSAAQSMRGRASSGRADVRTRSDGAVIIDDTYNANPQSMQNALESLSEVAKAEKRRAVCVLGAMLELGPASDAAHDSLGEAVANAEVDLFIGCGGLVDRAISRARARGVRTLAATGVDEAASFASREVGPSDVVLVKGSRSVGAERVVAALFAVSRAAHRGGS